MGDMSENRGVPPEDEPLILSDKFVTPAEAIVWLDPTQFAPGQGTPVQFGEPDDSPFGEPVDFD